MRGHFSRKYIKRRGMLVTVYCQRTPSKLCRAEGSSVSPPVWPSCGTLQHYLNGLLFYIPWILRPLQEPRIHWTFAECRQKGWTHGRVQKYPSPLFFSKYYNTLLPLKRLRMTFWILGLFFIHGFYVLCKSPVYTGSLLNADRKDGCSARFKNTPSPLFFKVS